MEGRPLIRLTDVGKRWDNGLEAVRGVSLRVEPGEFVSLLGASGCGKSTVLRIAAGLEAPSRGRVEMPQAAGGDVAFVFQEPTLMPWASVHDNVWLPLRLAGQRRAAAATSVREALATVGLSAFADAYPAQLSGGMKMRASIARALVTRPRVLLMDEPFAALDDLTRGRLNADLLAWWQAQRLAALFVTHNIAEAVFLSSRVLVMAPRPGRVVAEHVIDEPYPRQPSFRSSPRYLDHGRALAEALEAAHEAAAASGAEGSAPP